LKKLLHSVKLYCALYGEVYAVLILAFVLTFTICWVTVSRPVFGLARLLAEIGVGIISFGGVIFALLFQEMRKVATSLRLESQRLKDEFEKASANEERERITRSKGKVDDALGSTAILYLRVRLGFLISFASIGFELLVSVSLLWFHPDRVTMSSIVSLLGMSTAGMIYAIARSSSLPLGLNPA